VPVAAFREGMQAEGLPPPLIEMEVEYCAAVREGRAAFVTDEVAQLIGRAPRGYAAWAHEHARAFL
jgi:(4-alkanoyl-5-oxo-2,5-dihydrofuran-3-yl)methyl phosphate reductase